MKNIAKMIAMIAAVFCVTLAVPGSAKAADSTDTTRHYFTCYTSATQKIEYFVEGSDMVIVTKSQGSSYDFSKHYYETCLNRYFEFYRLNADSSGVELIYPRKYKEYTLSDGVWTVATDYAASNYPEYRGYSSMVNFYVDFSQMDCDILEVNLLDRGTAFNKGTGQMEYKTVDHNLNANLYSYLLNGTFTDYGKNYIFVSHSDAKTLVPGFASASKNGTLQQSSISITVDYDEESGVVSWNDFFTVEENTVFKGVLALFEVSPGSEQFAYRTVLTGSSYKISLGGCDFNNKDKRYSRLILRPYYINTNGSIYYGSAQGINIDADSVAATRSASSMLTQVKSSTSSGGIVPDKGENSSDYWEKMWSVYTYDAGCFFNGFVTTNVYATMDMGLGGSKKTDVVASYLARWNSVSTTYSDRATNFIRVDLGCGSEWVTFSHEYAYFSDPSVQFNSVELSNFIYKKWDNPQGPFCLRLTPYYTTRSGGSYYGKPVYFDFDIFGSIKSVSQYDGDFRDENSYDFTDITQKDYFEDNSVIGDLFDDIFNDSGSSEDNPFSINDLTFNFFSLLKDLISACGQFPALIASVFSFLPSVYTSMLVVALGLVVILRIVGR